MPRNDNVQILLGLQQLRGCVSISVFSFRFPFPVSVSFPFPAFPYAHCKATPSKSLAGLQ